MMIYLIGGLLLIVVFLTCVLFKTKYNAKQYLIYTLPRPRTLSMTTYGDNGGKFHNIVHRSFRSHAEANRLFKRAWNCTEEGLGGEGWEQRFYSDRDVERWITSHYGRDSTITTAYNLINPAYGASRADYFRYLLLFVEGGLWLDIKSCAVSPPPPFPDGVDIMISPWIFSNNVNLFGLRGEFQNWHIYAKPRSKALWSVIERVTQNIYDVQQNPHAVCTKLADASTKSKALVLGVTGPAAYTIAMDDWMKKKLTGVQITKPNLNGCVRYSVLDHEKLDIKHYSRVESPFILQ